MTKQNLFQRCDFQPEVMKNWGSALLFLVMCILSSTSNIDAFQKNEGNILQENGLPSQEMLQTAANQLRCDHLRTLRIKHYHLLLASLSLAEAAEYTFHGEHKPQYSEELGKFKLTRSRYLASWDQVRQDIEKIYSSSLSSTIISANQCQTGNSCSTKTWSQGCYQCMPGRDGRLPPSCLHSALSNGFLHIMEEKVRDVQQPIKENNCTDSIIGKLILDIKKQSESIMIDLTHSCSKDVVETPALQNIYERVQFLEYQLKDVRKVIGKQHDGISVDCDDAYSELTVDKVDVLEQHKGESGIKISVNDSDPCLKYVLVPGLPVSASNGSCWYIAKDKDLITNSDITSGTYPSSFTKQSSPGGENSSQLSSENYTPETSYTTITEKPTTIPKELNCSTHLRIMIRNIHPDIPNIEEIYANVSLKAAECLKESESLNEIGDILSIIEMFVHKAKEALAILESKTKIRRAPKSAVDETITADQHGTVEMKARIRSSLEKLLTSIEELLIFPDHPEEKSRVKTVAKNVASILKQEGDVGSGI